VVKRYNARRRQRMLLDNIMASLIQLHVSTDPISFAFSKDCDAWFANLQSSFFRSMLVILVPLNIMFAYC